MIGFAKQLVERIITIVIQKGLRIRPSFAQVHSKIYKKLEVKK